MRLSVPFLDIQGEQALAYMLGAGLATQSVKSALTALKKVFTSIHGTEEYNERTRRAATDNLNVFANAINFAVGSDSLSSRLFHLKQASKDFTLSVTTGFAAYLIFQTYENPMTTPPPPVEEEKFENMVQNYSSILSRAHDLADDVWQEIEFNRFGAEYRLTETCQEILSEWKEINLQELTASKKNKFFDCVREHILYVLFQEDCRENSKLIDFQQKHLKDLNKLDLDKPNSLQKVGSNDSKKALSKKTNNYNAILSSGILNEYNSNLREAFKIDLEAFIYDNYEPLKNLSQARFDHFVKTNLRPAWGPFILKIDDLCKSSLVKQKETFLAGLAQTLKNAYCQDYFKKFAENEEILGYENDLSKIKISPSRSNAKERVFDPAIEDIVKTPNPLAYARFGLTKSQWEAFLELYKTLN